MRALEQAQNVIGKTLTDKGYMSTTRDKDIAENFQYFTGADHPVVMVMHGTRGLRGVDASNVSEYVRQIEAEDPQREVLLSRNQSYTVRGFYAQNGTIFVDVDMVHKKSR